MKINKINSFTQKKTRENSRANQDLTSFGAAENKATSPVHSTKAAAAIKSNFLSGVSFKGYTETIVHGKVGTAGAIAIVSDPKEAGSASFSPYSTTKELIGKRPGSFANSSIEETGSNNGYITDRIYFADPEEVVNEQTKRDHDYIVYDNRPHYPRLEKVKENYEKVGQNARNYGQDFKTIAEYYIRREKADRKELHKLKEELKSFAPEYEESLSYKKMLDEKEEMFPWKVDAVKRDREKSDYFYSLNSKKYEDLNQKIGYYELRIEDSKNQQRKAVEAYKIFDEVGLMMFDRDKMRNNLNSTASNISGTKSHIENTEKNLVEMKEKAEETREKLKIAKEWKNLQVKNLNKEKENLASLERKNGWYYSEIDNSKKEIAELNNDINKFNDKILRLADRLIKLEASIKASEDNIRSCREYIEKATAELPVLQREFDKKCSEIWSYWPKMEEFYRNNIEEWQY